MRDKEFVRGKFAYTNKEVPMYIVSHIIKQGC